MAGDEESSKWSLDLDASDAISSLNDFSDTLKKVFSADDISGLLEKFESLGITLGVVGAAIFAMKESLDLVLEAEQIQAINTQFQQLTDNAGIAGDRLKEGLLDAAKGTITETEALQAANKALVSMGQNAEKLPQIMDLARQATSVYGGTVLDNFNKINSAIETGNTRRLRDIGLKGDDTKAEIAYGRSIGVTVDQLTQSQKQAAILNEVLAEGKNRFKDQNADLREATTAWQQFKTAISELGEAATLIFNSVFGSTVKKGVQLLADMATGLKNVAYSAFGDEAQKTESKINQLNLAILRQTQSISDMKAKIEGGKVNQTWVGYFNQDIAAGQAKIEKWKQEIASARQLASQKLPNQKSGTAGDKTEVDQNAATNAQKLASDKKYYDELNKLEAARISSQKQVMTTETQADQVFASERALIVQQAEAKEAQIREMYRKDEITSQKQVDALLLQANQEKENKLKAQEMDIAKYRKQALDNYVKQSKSAFDGIGRAISAESQKAVIDLQDFSQVGEVAFKSLKKNSISAFEAMGQGSESAGDAMKGFMFNSIADIAEAQGELLLATALLNPLNGIAGAALLVLAGFLRGQAGGSGGGSSAPGAGGDASAAGPSALGGSDLNNTGTSLDMTQQAQGKGVTINVAGSYLETDATRNLITNLVRQSSDATDFNISSVGKSGQQ